MKSSTCLIFILFFIGFTFDLRAEINVNTVESSIYAPKSEYYQWYFNGKKLDKENNQVLKIMIGGVYTVEFMKNGNITTEHIWLTISGGTIRRIFVIGDSTASIYDNSTYPRTGWAQVLQRFFNTDSILVVDKALSGRSSKSYYTDASGWPIVKSQLKAGDFLFIQFAHNDEKTTDTARYTDPYTTFKGYLSKYINESRALGAIPVLLTPIHRNNWNTDTITIKDSHGNYPPAMRQLATETKTPLLDITLKTQSLYQQFGKYATTWDIFLYANAGVYTQYPTGVADNTHLQVNGAIEIAKLVADAIWESSSDTIHKFLAPSLICNNSMNSIKYAVSATSAGYITGPTNIPANVKSYIKADPAYGFEFVNWIDDGIFYSQNQQINLQGNIVHNLVANFTEKITDVGQIISNDCSLRLFPTPAHQSLTIECTHILSEICIFDYKGECLLRLYPLKKSISFGIENLKSGLYLVRIKADSKRFMKKLIVL